MVTEIDIARFDPALKILSITELTEGWDRDVSLFNTDKGKLVVKKGKKDKSSTYNELRAKALITDKTLPIPQILYNDNEIIIETYAEGHTITDKEPPSVYKHLGESVKKINSIKTVGFGFFKDVGVGQFENEKDAMLNYVDIYHPTFKTHPMLQHLDIPYIVNKHINIFDNKVSVLTHSDLHLGNILVNDNKITGLTDFGDASAGPPERDIAKFYVNIGNNKAWDSFLEGYGKDFDERKFMYYSFLLNIKTVSWGHVKEGTEMHENFLKLVKYFT